MKDLVAELRASIAATLLLAALCCGVYPAVVLAIGQGLFPREADGSLIQVDGKVAGSYLLARDSRRRSISIPVPLRRDRGTTRPHHRARTWGPPR